MIMPNFNKSKYIGLAIESVLNQSFQNFELIIVDDASTDTSVEIAKAFQNRDSRIRVQILEEHSGPAAARNSGIRTAHAPLITFLDSDDLFSSDRLETQVSALSEAIDAGVAYSEPVYINEETKNLSISQISKKLRPSGWVLSLFLTKRFMTGCIYTVRKDCFQKVGLYDESLSNGENYDMQLRLARLYKFTYVPERSYGYRPHHFKQRDAASMRLYYLQSSQVIERHLFANLSVLDKDTKEQTFRKLFSFFALSKQWGKIARLSFANVESFRALLRLPFEIKKHSVK